MLAGYFDTHGGGARMAKCKINFVDNFLETEALPRGHVKNRTSQPPPQGKKPMTRLQARRAVEEAMAARRHNSMFKGIFDQGIKIDFL